MKPKLKIGLCGGLVAACVTPHVYAQSSVTLYGLIESALVSQNHASPGGGHVYSLNQAGEGFLSASRIGFLDSEDLGGGAACKRFAGRVPLLANMVEGGKTPVESAQTLTQLGFRIVIFPGGTARAVTHTLKGYYGSLRAHGTTTPWRDRMLDFDGINEVIGTEALLAEAQLYE
jgi:Gram-negative porin